MSISPSEVGVTSSLSVNFTTSATSYTTFLNDHQVYGGELASFNPGGASFSSINHYVTRWNPISLDVVLSPTVYESSDLAARKAITYSNVVNAVDYVSLNCPTPLIYQQYYFCDATFYGGTDATAKIEVDFPGTGNLQTMEFKPISKLIILSHSSENKRLF